MKAGINQKESFAFNNKRKYAFLAYESMRETWFDMQSSELEKANQASCLFLIFLLTLQVFDQFVGLADLNFLF